MQYQHRGGSSPSHPAGESRKPHLKVDFDCRLKLEFHGSKITSDAGLLAYRELDEVLGLTELGAAVLSDLRRGKNTRHLLTGLFRQSVFGRLAGFEDVNDAERLSRDPAMRVIVDRKGLDRSAALPNEVGHWSLTTLREKLIKIGAKVVRHGRYVTFQLAEPACRGRNPEKPVRQHPAPD